jgi:hypothetical protein
MKLGEAVLERDYLEGRLDVLEARLAIDVETGRPLAHILGEVEEAANRMLSLQDAIDWTLQHLLVGDDPLGAYLNKADRHERVAALLEHGSSPDLREKVDELRVAKKTAELLIQTIYWAYDLQIPGQEVDVEPEEEK